MLKKACIEDILIFVNTDTSIPSEIGRQVGDKGFFLGRGMGRGWPPLPQS